MESAAAPAAGRRRNGGTLAARLEAARRRAFVGRQRHLTAFDAALRGAGPQVLFVHGEGGIGKSTLLRELARRARAAGRTVVELDGRALDATPSGIAADLSRALGPTGTAGAHGNRAGDARDSDARHGDDGAHGHGRRDDDHGGTPGGDGAHGQAGGDGHGGAPGDDGDGDDGAPGNDDGHGHGDGGDGPDPVDGALDRIGGGDDLVLLIDGFELLAHLDGWLRARVLPALAATAVVVLAGRAAPGHEWASDPGWRDVARLLPLGPLDDAEARELLARTGAPAEARARLAALGRGHPLTLTMLADVAQAGAVPDELGDVPDLVAALVPILVRDVPDDACARGLLVCAHAWVTTEDLLREVLGPDDGPRVWAWLGSLGVVVRASDGLYPHDLARDVLDGEHAVRAPEQYRQIHQAIRAHVVGRLRNASGRERYRGAQELFHLHRKGPLLGVGADLRRAGAAARPGSPADVPVVVDMVRTAEGPAAAELAARWLAIQPDGLVVVEGPGGLLGYGIGVLVDPAEMGSGALPDDPVLRDLLPCLEAAGPTRPGELVHVGRFVGDVTGSPQRMAAVVAGSTASTLAWLTLPLSWAAMTGEEEFWAPLFDYLGFDLVTRVDTDGGRTLAAFALDLRRLPIIVWMEMMAERELSLETGPPPARLLRPPPLGRPAFGDAVRRALADLHRPDRLATNPLVGSRLVTDPEPTPAALRRAVEAAVGALGGERKGEVLEAVLRRTFVTPAPTQEAAAEVLGLPFSTYRRHLARGIDRVTELLWAVELGRSAPQVGGDWAAIGLEVDQP